MKAPVHIVWFKRDLRIEDHRPLAEAARQGAVLPLLIIEPELWAEPDQSARQYLFMRESAAALALELAKLGQPLIVRIGDACWILDALSDDLDGKYQIAGLWSHEETGNAWTFRRDQAVAAWCSKRGLAWHQFRQDGVVRRLATRDGWAKRWDRFMGAAIEPAPKQLTPVLSETAALTQIQPSDLGLGADPCAERQLGGREAALDTLYSFLNERGRPYRRAMSGPAEGAVACSRLSPHLAWGAVSMREVTQNTWARQRELKYEPSAAQSDWRNALISFNGRLHWHCHFMQKLESEPELEHRNLHRAYDGLRRPEDSDQALLQAWCAGETGLPFVDACMRCLAQTGWMNFRMRAMLVAVASYHLWLDWRSSGLHLARQFTDYEPGIHWPQTQMQSGTTGINTVRIYNPVKQGHDQDPDGEFVRRWVPELRAIDDARVHEPWKHPDAAKLLDRAYPMPVVDYIEAARAARQKIYGIRRNREFGAAADAIQTKHGSRRSGMPHTGQRTGQSAAKRNTAKSAKRKATPDAQLSFAMDLSQPTDSQPKDKTASRRRSKK